ncbi:MAG TPA: dual specificity protein phosphatase family protein [Pyrinomonadaceae bacterium]|nr:dual specificity protein phosphatase family protein [Pyrinomonadaceae bacterium]
MIRKHDSRALVRSLGVALMLLAFALAPATSVLVDAQNGVKPQPATTIKNFGKVDDNYYRGSQPSEVQMEELKRMGVKTIIDLRKDKVASAADWASRTGLQYFNILMKPSKAATDEQTAHFLSLVNDPENWPVYVHCKGGRHRTGALTAVYRITHNGWTAAQAWEEMKAYDFNDGLFGGPGAQKKFVFNFYQQRFASTGAVHGGANK